MRDGDPIIISDHGLSPGRRQAIFWSNAEILLIGPLATNFRDILIEIHIFSFTEMHLKNSSAEWRPLCLALNIVIMDSRNSSGRSATPRIIYHHKSHTFKDIDFKCSAVLRNSISFSFMKIVHFVTTEKIKSLNLDKK